MDLRKELLAENENSGEESLEKAFIEYIKGNKISKEDEEKILDELQKIVDSGNYKDSIFYEEISYCEYPSLYEKEVLRKKRWGFSSDDFRHSLFVYEQLKDVVNFPKAVTLTLEELKKQYDKVNYVENLKKKEKISKENMDKNFEICNKFFEKNNIEKLSKDYNIDTLEDNIFNFIKQNIEYKDDVIDFEKLHELFKQYETPLASVISSIDSQHYLLKNNSKSYFKNKLWIKAFYIKKMLQSKNAIYIFENEIDIKIYNFEKSQLESYGLCCERFFDKKDPLVIYNSNTIIPEQLKDKIKMDAIIWEDTAHFVLDPILNKIINLFSNFRMTLLTWPNNIDYNIYDKALTNYQEKNIKQHFSKILNNDLSNENAKILYMSHYLFIMKYNFFSVIYMSYDYDNNKMNFYINKNNQIKPFYGAFSKNDRIGIAGGKNNVSYDLSFIPTSNKASVIGRTIIGQAIGGTVGGIIGAASAVNRNARDDFIRKNQEPIIVNGSENCFAFSGYLYNTKNKIKKHIGSDIQSVELLKTSIKDACSEDNILVGELIKKYYEENKPDNYDEEKINNFIEKKLEKEKNKRKEEYWKKHDKEKKELDEKLEKLKEQELTLKEELNKLNETNLLKIKQIKEKYSKKTDEEKEIEKLNIEIEKLNEDYENCGLFSFSKKKDIKERIVIVEERLKALKEKVDKQKNKEELETRKLLKEQTTIEEELKNNQLEQQEIIDKLSV